MKARNMVVTVAVAAGLFVTGAVAQHDEHHSDPAAPGVKTGGMMAGKTMPQMMAGQVETGKLVDRLVESFAAIEAEKDPAALKAKLTEHAALLKELQAKVKGHAHMMETMHSMMGEHKN